MHLGRSGTSVSVNGRVFPTQEQARAVCAATLARGLLVETAGERGQVVGLMPPLTTTTDDLRQGLDDLLTASCEAA